MTKQYTIEVTKSIVITIDDESYQAACVSITNLFAEGEFGDSWDKAPPSFRIVQVDLAE